MEGEMKNIMRERKVIIVYTMLPMRKSVYTILLMGKLCEFYCSVEEFVYTIVHMSRDKYRDLMF